MKERESKMKKLLGLTALVTILALAACSNTTETVCTSNEMGMEVVVTVQSEDGEITSAHFEISMDGEVIDSETIDAADMDGDTNLDDFIATMENAGATCN